MQSIKRIDRVRRPLAANLDVRDLESVLIATDGQATHFEAMGCAGLLVDGLVRRYPCGYEHHSREAELNVRLLGADQMTKMWRIERPAEDSDAHDVSGRGGSRTDLAVAFD